MVYYLGKDIFDRKTGIIAAAVALTSPNLWFHGEIALTYVVEAFFSTFVALLCWRIYKGKHSYIWLSVLALAVAGGIRQNTMVFLLPLWLFSVKGVPIRKTIASLGVLVVSCLLWFVPMVYMTGGWHAYQDAFRELWLFNTGHVSVFEKGWATFKIFSSSVSRFTLYGIGAGVFVLGLALYSLVRNKRLASLDRKKIAYFSLWILPSFFFYLLIFIHPANPGYVLIYLPALFILLASSAEYLGAHMKSIMRRDLATHIAIAVIIFNTAFFFLSRHPVTYQEIRTHDSHMLIMLTGIKQHNPDEVAIFVGPYVFYGYRQIMYYLPEYRVYQVDVRVLPTGEERKTFWGIHGKTYVTDEIIVPESIGTFLMPFIADDKEKVSGIKEVSIEQLKPINMYLACGDISRIKDIYPELRIR
jgi:hypothetical protein